MYCTTNVCKMLRLENSITWVGIKVLWHNMTQIYRLRDIQVLFPGVSVNLVVIAVGPPTLRRQCSWQQLFSHVYTFYLLTLDTENF